MRDGEDGNSEQFLFILALCVDKLLCSYHNNIIVLFAKSTTTASNTRTFKGSCDLRQ